MELIEKIYHYKLPVDKRINCLELTGKIYRVTFDKKTNTVSIMTSVDLEKQ